MSSSVGPMSRMFEMAKHLAGLGQKLCVAAFDEAEEEPDGSTYCWVAGGYKVKEGEVVILIRAEDWKTHTPKSGDFEDPWLGRITKVDGKSQATGRFYCNVRPMEPYFT